VRNDGLQRIQREVTIHQRHPRLASQGIGGLNMSKDKDKEPKKEGWFDLDEKPRKRRRKGIWPWDW